MPFFYGHFWQKCPSLSAQKWHFGCPDENSETTFISPTSPKNDGIAFDFKRLRLLGWVTSPFLNIVIFYQFWALFPLARTPTQNSGAIGQILRYMSEIFFGASCDGGTRCPSWHKLKSNFQYIGTPYCIRPPRSEE